MSPQIPLPPIPAPGNYPLMNPREAAAPFAEIEQAGAQVERLAYYSLGVAKTIQSAEDQVAVLKARNEVNADLDSAFESHLQDTDYQTLSERAGQEAETIRKKYAELYATNPRVSRVIGPYVEAQVQDFQKAMELKRVGLLNKDYEAQVAIASDSYQRMMATAPNPEVKEMYRNDFYGTVLAAVNVGAMTQEQGYVARQNFDIGAEKTELITGLRSNDIPTRVHMIDKAKEKDSFPALKGRDPEWVAGQVESAEAGISVLQDKLKRQADEAAVDESLDTLRADYGDDIPGALKTLDSKEFQKQHGLLDEQGHGDRNRIEQIRTSLRARLTENQAAEKKVHDEFDKEVGTMFAKGDYSGVLKAIRGDNPLTGDERRTIAISVREAMKAREDTPGAKKEKETKAYAQIAVANDMMRRGDDPAAIRRFIDTNPYLEKADKEQYRSKLEAKVSREIEEGRSDGYADIKAIIFPGVELMDPQSVIRLMLANPQKAQSVTRAQTALDGWIAQQLKEGKDPTRNEVRIKAQKLAEGLGVSVLQGVQGKLDSMNR